MKPFLMLFRQEYPQPRDGKDWIVGECVITCDGPRHRISNNRFATEEQARSFIQEWEREHG